VYVVADELVLATKSVQLELPLGDTSILYPVRFAPPVLVGAVQDRLILVGPAADAEREVGAPGAVAALVVALTVEDADPVLPAELIALTR